MKQIILLFMILGSAASLLAQSSLVAGDNCFDKGDYVCAKMKYQQTMDTAVGRVKQIAEIKYSRANSCNEWLTIANRAFNNSNYLVAKENFQFILNENPEDSYAQAQIENCNIAIEAAITLSVAKENISLSPFGGSERIYVDTNAESYSLSQFPTWYRVQKYSGYFDVTYDGNTSKIVRTAGIEITAGKKVINISLIQSPKPKKEITLTVSKENISINSDIRMIMVDVNSNADDYQITNLPGWCRVNDKHATWFFLECDENYSSSSRDGSFNVIAGGKKVKINIYQTGARSSQKSEITTKYRSRTSDYSFFAIGYEGGQIAKYGFRMEFGGRKFIGMFFNVRSTIILDEELFENFGYLENKNEAIIGLNFRISRGIYLNLGGGYGYYKIPGMNETLNQVEYFPAYGGLTFRLGRRFNFSVGASFRDIEQNIDSSSFDPEFTLGLTINLKK